MWQNNKRAFKDVPSTIVHIKLGVTYLHTHVPASMFAFPGVCTLVLHREQGVCAIVVVNVKLWTRDLSGESRSRVGLRSIWAWIPELASK